MKRVFLLLFIIFCFTNISYAGGPISGIPSDEGAGESVLVEGYWDLTEKRLVPLGKTIPLIDPDNKEAVIAHYGNRWISMYGYSVGFHTVRTEDYVDNRPVAPGSAKVYGLPFDLGGRAVYGVDSQGIRYYWKTINGTYVGKDVIVKTSSNFNIWAYNRMYYPFATSSQDPSGTSFGYNVPRYRGFTNVGQLFLNPDFPTDQLVNPRWWTLPWYQVSNYKSYFGPDNRELYSLYYRNTGEIDSPTFRLLKSDIANPAASKYPGPAAAIRKSLEEVRDMYFHGNKAKYTPEHLFEILNPLSIRDDGFVGCWYGWHNNGGSDWYVTFTIPADDTGLNLKAETPKKVINVDPGESFDILGQFSKTDALDKKAPTAQVKDMESGEIYLQEEIPELLTATDGKKIERSVPMAFDQIGTYKIQININDTPFRDGIPDETTYTDNYVEITINVGNTLNLKANSLQVLTTREGKLVSTLSGKVNDEYILNAVVSNAAESAAAPEEPTIVELRCLTTGKKERVTIPSLSPGQSMEVPFAWIFDKPQTYKFEVEINPDRIITETTYSDNIVGTVVINVTADYKCFDKPLAKLTEREYIYTFKKDFYAERLTRSKVMTTRTVTRIDKDGNPYQKDIRVWDYPKMTPWKSGWVLRSSTTEDKPFKESFIVKDVLIKSRDTKNIFKSTMNGAGNAPPIKTGYGFEMKVVTAYNTDFRVPANVRNPSDGPTVPRGTDTGTNTSMYTGVVEARYSGDVKIDQNTCLEVVFPNGESFLCGNNSESIDLKVGISGTKYKNERSYTFVPKNTYGVGYMEEKYYTNVNVAPSHD